jgi:hypothetical protein
MQSLKLRSRRFSQNDPVNRIGSNPGCGGRSGCALLSQRARLARGDCDLAWSIRAGACGETGDLKRAIAAYQTLAKR